jgi:hypothetical protein
MDFRGSCGKIVSVADVEAEEHRELSATNSQKEHFRTF